MTPTFISMLYFEGYVLAFTECGDVWRFDVHLMQWSLLCRGPRERV